MLMLPVGLLLLLWGALVWGERALIFPRPSLSQNWLEMQAHTQGAHKHLLKAEDGTTLYAWHIPAGGRSVLIWFDGNATSVGMREYEFARIHALGVDIVHVNYRGYPGSKGRPSERGLRMDARAAWAFAEKIAPRRVIYGKSLGGGVAMGLAAERPADGLIVESSFASIAQVGQELFSFLPTRLLMRNPFDSVALAPKVRVPTLLLHGDADELIGVHHLSQLAKALPQPPTTFILPGGQHNSKVLMDEDIWPTVVEMLLGVR